MLDKYSEASVCFSVCLSVCLSVSLSVSLSVCLSVCISCDIALFKLSVSVVHHSLYSESVIQEVVC